MDEQEPALSVVVPASNEEAVLPLFHRRRRLLATLDGLRGRAEILHVNDGGDDWARAVLQPLRATGGRAGPLERTAREMARAD